VSHHDAEDGVLLIVDVVDQDVPMPGCAESVRAVAGQVAEEGQTDAAVLVQAPLDGLVGHPALFDGVLSVCLLFRCPASDGDGLRLRGEEGDKKEP
jgi:hypothetical protein